MQPAGSSLVDDPAETLRDRVLAGRFFGERHAEAVEALASFVSGAEPHGLTAWFGALPAARLAMDPERLRCALDRDIAAIDALIGAQLDAVLHSDRLRRIEGSWRGLAWLVDGIEPNARVKVRLLSLGWPELCRDLERAAEFDQSNLFHRIYEDEFGTPGGEPFGLLIVDQEIRHRRMPGYATDDVSALALLGGVAAAAFAPVVLAASPTLFEVDDFPDLATVADPAASFRGPDHARWRGLSSREDMRFVGVTLPRVLARRPWADNPARTDGFRYSEHAPHASDRVWSTAVYGFANAVIRAFTSNGWPADVRGAEIDSESGGLVDELPVEPFSAETREVWSRPSLDLVLDDRQERLLVEAGLMPLSGLPFSEQGMFSAVQSMQAPQQYIGTNANSANANARISAQLNSMLCVSRFAHYIKMKGREMVGSYQLAEDIEQRLQTWIMKYTNSNTGAGLDTMARYPLLSARVTVREKPGRPGVFACTVHLQPQLQLDDVAASFRLVTDIVAPGAKA